MELALRRSPFLFFNVFQIHFAHHEIPIRSRGYAREKSSVVAGVARNRLKIVAATAASTPGNKGLSCQSFNG